jgi:signal transduction histidine kinase
VLVLRAPLRRQSTGGRKGRHGRLRARSVTHIPVRDWRDARQRILARYLELLAEAGSPLLRAGAPVRRQVEDQLLGVVDAVHARLTGNGSVPVDGSGARLSENIGRTRATARIHPSQSLRAASMIFEAALPTLAEELRRAGAATPELTAGLALNTEILERMSAAARAYVDYLLDKAHSSNRDERRRLSRELHDVAAPTVAIALQNLELYDVYAQVDPERASDKIDAARQSMIDALATLRSLAAQSRESVAANGLVEAIHRYLDTLPPEVKTELVSRGEFSALALSYAEEVFLIVREAVRNAVDHGKPTRVSVNISMRPGELRARITDDGIGFHVSNTLARESHVGIDSMFERADLLGANLKITSKPGSGTTVAISISLPANGS